MIASLRGKIINQFEDSVVLDVAGVGYGVYVNLFDLGSIEINQELSLYIYEHIREQAHDLYGFLSYETKLFFEALLDVSGVGPKMALKVLDIGRVSDIKKAIASSNVLYIKQASGVGQKVAERIIIELKNKVFVENSADIELGNMLNKIDQSDEALQALISLGFTQNDATKALMNVDRSLPIEEQIKVALKEKK